MREKDEPIEESKMEAKCSRGAKREEMEEKLNEQSKMVRRSQIRRLK